MTRGDLFEAERVTVGEVLGLCQNPAKNERGELAAADVERARRALRTYVFGTGASERTGNSLRTGEGEGDDRVRLDEAAKELERERKREWYRENAALVSERHRARYASDPEFRAKRKAMADRYRAAHREEILAKRRAYYREHREAILANERARRIRKKEASE